MNTLRSTLNTSMSPQTHNRLTMRRRTLTVRFIRILPNHPTQRRIQTHSRRTQNVKINQRRTSQLTKLSRRNLIIAGLTRHHGSHIRQNPITHNTTSTTMSSRFNQVLNRIQVRVILRRPMHNFNRPTTTKSLQTTQNTSSTNLISTNQYIRNKTPTTNFQVMNTHHHQPHAKPGTAKSPRPTSNPQQPHGPFQQDPPNYNIHFRTQ